MGALSLVRGFSGPPSTHLSYGLLRTARSEYLDGYYGAILGDPGDKSKAVHWGIQSTFPPFYRKDLIGVWYYNLRGPLKAISLGHPRDIGARPQYKER
jgi:hypothetical protein